MKILITSGGTTEKIDAVRGITNHSTGYLGKEIAELFYFFKLICFKVLIVVLCY